MSLWNFPKDSFPCVHMTKNVIDGPQLNQRNERAAVKGADFKLCHKYIGILWGMNAPMTASFICRHRESPNIKQLYVKAKQENAMEIETSIMFHKAYNPSLQGKLV